MNIRHVPAALALTILGCSPDARTRSDRDGSASDSAASDTGDSAGEEPDTASSHSGDSSGGDTDSGTHSGGDDTGGDSGRPCRITLLSTTPSDGAADADYRTPIAFELSRADETATIVTDIPGTQSASTDGGTIYWTPTAPLVPLTSYSVTLAYCGGNATISFRTSDVGTPVDPTSLGNEAWSLNLAHAHVSEPPGIGDVLLTYLDQELLFGVVGASSASLRSLGAVAVADSSPQVQDYCAPSFAFPDADFTGNPWFSAGPSSTTLSVAGYPVSVTDIAVSGSFAPDHSSISGATFTGVMDTRTLSALIDESGNQAAICELARSFGASCSRCPVDGAPFCLTLAAEGIDTAAVPGPLVEVAGTHCTDCESGPPASDATCD